MTGAETIGTRSLPIRLSDAMDTLAKMAAILILGVLVLVVLLQVVARYAFSSPPSWTEELARYAMIWAGLLGATLSFKRVFDPALMTGRFRHRVLASAARIFQSVIVLIYLLPILWHCFFGPNVNFQRGFLTRSARTTAESLDFSTIYVAIAVPIMIVLVLIHLVARWAGDRPAPAED